MAIVTSPAQPAPADAKPSHSQIDRTSDLLPGGPSEDRSSVPVGLTSGDRTALYRFLVLMRTIEERGVTLYKQGKLPGSFYDGRGQEAISVGAAFALGPDDVISSPLIRDLGAHLVRGTDITELFRHYLGRQNVLSHGREGNMHFGDHQRGIVAPVSMLPDMMVVALGLAMAFRMRGEQRVALSFFGEGATSRGDWHEAMNWAGLRREPVIYVCENNQLAYSTPSSRQFAVRPSERAKGYGVAAELIDGNDVEAVHAAVHRARERALSGGGATLIEAETMRMNGHGSHDDASYVAPELRAYWEARDPLDRYAAVVRELGVDVDAVRAEVSARVDAAAEAALATPLPDPETAATGVFCDGDPTELGRGGDAPWSRFAGWAGGAGADGAVGTGTADEAALAEPDGRGGANDAEATR
ncbi:MAG: thiamine pyrophosphate-dependent dehydrogenase E1 component subunit alpha [Patulibacter sp.]|nr:thiamine pyrophosphate-dependent dehydrogenase E1 component subunit alpha [Patulibacter sp.]